ncbi:zeta toxin family protein [Brachybacterium tyrofermentans]|uniref:zeta toxin family protein n=1 Tax=Brachybacterium tyrofermentans TaxID=47848 RepID=UPI003FD2E70A
MNDAIDRHIDHVRELTRRGGALDPCGATASIHNPAWFLPDGTPTSARRRLHATIRAESLAQTDGQAAPSPRVMILAGPPGAGKSTLREEELREEIAGHVLIDPDDIKTRLLKEAGADRSLEEFLTPQGVRALEAQGEKFFPLELSALVHMEAVQVARRLRGDAIRAGLPMVIDGVLSQPSEALALGGQFEAAGYSIDVVAADVPFEVSEHRIRERWREAYADTLAGKGDLLGGRWVPSDYARAMFDGPEGRSRSVVTAEQLANQVAAVDRYRVFRTAAVDAPTVLATDLARVRGKGPLIDREAAEAYRTTVGPPAHLRRRAQPRAQGYER